ncbi:MAG: GNAT family N-acetyltransferase [Saprospiraceae bacterium]|nr:GNAT family N-acetyltransferase [bacterium]MDC3209875.1 GNAT family N-acetyltransferase [Saprospiraceae bacterium]MDG2419431.1 GNAT family N-acetyltransferase [Saprospiraceae bacterium]
MKFEIKVATDTHLKYAEEVCKTIEQSAKLRGTGIAKRNINYIEQKIKSGNAVIALLKNTFIGFCYIETWEHGKYVANSGLIVAPNFRGYGLAKKIKSHVFNHARNKFPNAKIFGITTSLPVMKINSSLGYHPVTFSELPQDDAFWKSCRSCPNFDILTRNNRKICLCTGMLAPSKNQMEYDLTYLISEKKHS